jgi:hypothetical protein
MNSTGCQILEILLKKRGGMKRLLWTGSIVAVFCLTLFSLRNVYAAEPVQESMQAMVEVMILKVELGSKDATGLTWGKNGEMREKDSATIVEWLKKQGDLTLICGRNFYVDNKKETLVQCTATVAFVKPQGQSAIGYSYHDVGTSMKLTPEISNNEVAMRTDFNCTFLLGPDSIGKYNTVTFLHAKNGKTLVIDEIIAGSSVEPETKVTKIALVVLITPHILK